MFGNDQRWSPPLQENNHTKNIVVVNAILEWIDENLPDMIKQGINFRKTAKTLINFSTNPNFCAEERRGTMSFENDRIIITCRKGRYSFKTDWTVECVYADPKMFDHVATALRRIFNGT